MVKRQSYIVKKVILNWKTLTSLTQDELFLLQKTGVNRDVFLARKLTQLAENICNFNEGKQHVK